MGKKPRAETYNACLGPQEHRDHFCHLMEKGMTEEIRRRSDQPAYICRNCRARANEPADLCNPDPLEK